MKYGLIFAALLASTTGLGFVWGTAVGTNDARALAHYDAVRACSYLGSVSQ